MNVMTVQGTILISLFCFSSLLANAAEINLIDFSDDEGIAGRRPIIIAHRGGVITPQSHECSLSAIRLAAEAGYDMVELDVQRSSDGVPIVFHDRSLKKACGIDAIISDFSADKLETIRYLRGEDRIVRLNRALMSCQQFGLGIMLDLKVGLDSQEFLEMIDQLLVKNGLGKATISFSGSGMARRYLKHVRFTPTNDEMSRLRTGETVDLSKRFWFGLPRQLQPGDIEKLKSAGALIIPAINTFRYPSANHFKLAELDIIRLSKEGVDGFQIDSIYFSFFPVKDK